MTDLPTLLWTSVGTGLCIASANRYVRGGEALGRVRLLVSRPEPVWRVRDPSINQWIEAPYDAQMSRTRTRPRPRRAASPFTAFAIGIGALARDAGRPGPQP